MPQPDLILTPFAQDAPPSAVDPIPETRSPSDPLEKATWRDGFPGLTMIPLAAGGIPPRGQDFNGVLKAISEHIAFQGGGGQYKWSSEIADNGGYEKDSIVLSDDGLALYVSAVNGNTTNFNTTPGSIGTSWLLFAGVSALDSKAEKSTQVIAGTGLLGGGDLSVNRTLSVDYGTTAGTAAQGNDPRLSPIFTSITGSAAISAGQLGMVLADSTTSDSIIDLPASNSTLGVRDVIVRRIDNSGNRLTVRAAGSDLIKFHTDKRAEGYPFFYLLGAGDYWHLRSDGAGSWWLIGRLDGTSLGRPVFETTTTVSPGGWGVFAGTIFNRDEWPWLWDHAQQSGMLTTEAARVGMEGGWTSGDGALTFRGPEGRGEFLRVLDDGRGVDPARAAGSYQKGSVSAVDINSPAVQGTCSNLASGPESLLRLGYDAPVITEYQGVLLAGANQTSTTQLPGSTEVWGGVTRSRNIAYPGRIKLI